MNLNRNKKTGRFTPKKHKIAIALLTILALFWGAVSIIGTNNLIAIGAKLRQAKAAEVYEAAVEPVKKAVDTRDSYDKVADELAAAMRDMQKAEQEMRNFIKESDAELTRHSQKIASTTERYNNAVFMVETLAN